MKKSCKDKAREQGADFFHRFQERAGIMEFDGGFPTKDADRLAYHAILMEDKCNI